MATDGEMRDEEEKKSVSIEAIRKKFTECCSFVYFDFSIEPMMVGEVKHCSYFELDKMTNFKNPAEIQKTFTGNYSMALLLKDLANTHPSLVKLYRYCFDTRLAVVYDAKFTSVQLSDVLLSVFDFGYVSNHVNEDANIPVKVRVGGDAPEILEERRECFDKHIIRTSLKYCRIYRYKNVFLCYEMNISRKFVRQNERYFLHDLCYLDFMNVCLFTYCIFFAPDLILSQIKKVSKVITYVLHLLYTCIGGCVVDLKLQNILLEEVMNFRNYFYTRDIFLCH
ncbi:hypothetical protein R3W88_018759 [Solanum pinnatisectum]|uniref:Protein kinase domain-containing protein n=1 Tax=Solanum pinnatisectum TaxID=50273 RepID=A0AAV9KHL4_9SOLN|nr:hypothetical protein R3W88_018759 [Solanum pinnatisectum]